MNTFRALFFCGLIYSMSNSAFAECIQGDCTNGVGQFRYKNNSLLISEFSEGRAHGYGVKKYTNGTICEGYTRKGIWHGLRHCYWEKTGKRFYGNYNSGKRSAEAIQLDSQGMIETEGYYYRGKLQRTYEIDRARLLERFQQMRAEADPQITKTLPIHMKVFYIPSSGQTKLAVEPMHGSSFVEKGKDKSQSSIQESKPLKIGGDRGESKSSGDVFAPSNMQKGQNSTEQKRTSQPTESKIDEATKWAIKVCEEEGYITGSTQFGVCVGKMREVY